jgi:hypothetical protein
MLHAPIAVKKSNRLGVTNFFVQLNALGASTTKNIMTNILK